ncbi:MAG TPA: M17 family peptidase N-terminal domain-containing protein, partial [Thiolinea sp.]|nr:M17 family peptidase N-terminal domain-containing protein [Thiolinea sp.]
MNYQFQANSNVASAQADCVIVGVYKNNELSQAAAQLDIASSGAIASHLELGDFGGDKNRASMLYQLQGVAAKRTLLVGLGERDKLNVDTLTQATYCAANTLKATKAGQVLSFLTDEANATWADSAVRQSVTAVADTFYSFNDFKSNKDEIPVPNLEQWVVAHRGDTNLDQATRQGVAIAEGMKLCRDLSNSPGNTCTPTYLAKAALKLGHSQANLEVEILEEAHMAELGMGSFLSVSKGSEEPGKMIILHYKGGKEGDAPLALVGKGITFDTGGISLKPGAAMDEMKFDMTGAASVLGTLAACVAMQLPINVIGVLAAAENMPSGKASKPGDIVTSMAGKTIEILNTDAEGRLIL